jgi:light-regulated signal transduction histidine kinase (bacteriophytochrome)
MSKRMLDRLPGDNKKMAVIAADYTAAYLDKEKRNILEAKRELDRSRRELELVCYMASHDLQEPLRMVASYTQLLAKRYRGMLDDDADDFISCAVDGAARMQRLINNMLAFSRVDKKKGKELIPTDCEYVLRSAVADLELVIKESGAVITCDPMPVVMADDVQLIQVFQNLIGNAVKFHGDGKPEIHVGAERKEYEWIFSVRDNGLGIKDMDREQIFIMFVRAHDREKYSGTGIGLAICKKIVEHHGGRIWVESEPEKGSAFYFSIPVEAGGYDNTDNQ